MRFRRLLPCRVPFFAAIAAAVLLCGVSRAQDGPLVIEIHNGAGDIRLATANFKGQGDLKAAFDTTLYADLGNAGIFDLVSKSMMPQAAPGSQGEINLQQWGGAPTNAAMVVFGNFSSDGGKLVVNGFLDDAKNTQYPQVFAKQYTDVATEDAARQTAHRFADEIITRLGGRMAGIAESKIYFVKYVTGGTKEIWEMDYDGANQHAISHLGATALSPRISPDNSRLAFSTLDKRGWTLRMYSMLLGRMVNFNGSGISPAWSPDGQSLAFSSDRSGEYEIWVSDAGGNLAHKVTSFRGGNASPTWNPKTGAQIAWISGRTGLPQLYIMDADGSGVQRLTDGGYASSPSWSPNGQFVAFAWNRKYGPGAPGGQDIYVMEIATKRWIQLTHDIGRCDFPSWSPDGRHIVFANQPGSGGGSTRIMSMLVDGSDRKTLTGAGSDMPNWSWH